MELLKYMCILFQAYEVDIIWAVNHQHNVFLKSIYPHNKSRKCGLYIKPCGISWMLDVLILQMSEMIAYKLLK